MESQGLVRLHPGLDISTLSDSTEGIMVTLTESESFFDNYELHRQISYCQAKYPLTKLHIELDNNHDLIEFYNVFNGMFGTLRELHVKYLPFKPDPNAHELLTCYFTLEMPHLVTIVWEEPKQEEHYSSPCIGVPVVFAAVVPRLNFASVMFRTTPDSNSKGSLELMKCRHLQTLHVSLGEMTIQKLAEDGLNSIEMLRLVDIYRGRADFWCTLLSGMRNLRTVSLVRCRVNVVSGAKRCAEQSGIGVDRVEV